MPKDTDTGVRPMLDIAKLRESRNDLAICQHDGCIEVYRCRGLRDGEMVGYAILCNGFWNAYVRASIFGNDLRFISEEDTAERAVERVFQNS